MKRNLLLKVCRPWSSSAELGSAVKSAILHELEFNPKPGWIRADIVPSSDAVEKLKQKIADLEERLKKRKFSGAQPFPDGAEKVLISIVVKYDFQDDPDPERSWNKIAKQKFEYEYETTWDGLVLLFRSNLQSGSESQVLRGTINEKLNEIISPLAVKTIGKPDPEYAFSIQNTKLEIILKTLMARKLIKMLPGEYGTWSNPQWIFTPNGVQYLAELQAARSAS
jgi:hypothetical protein